MPEIIKGATARTLFPDICDIFIFEMAYYFRLLTVLIMTSNSNPCVTFKLRKTLWISSVKD